MVLAVATNRADHPKAEMVLAVATNWANRPQVASDREVMLAAGPSVRYAARLCAAWIGHTDYTVRLAAVKFDRSCFFLAISMHPAAPGDLAKPRPQALTQFGMPVLLFLAPASIFPIYLLMDFYSSL